MSLERSSSIKDNLLNKKNVGYAAMAIFVLFTVYSFTVGPYSLVVIVNEDLNSMYPGYFQGDIFIIKEKPASEIKIGDVIVYRNHLSNAPLIIHRVIEIIELSINGQTQLFFRVKGDNPIENSVPDNTVLGGGLIPYESIIGVVVSRLPWLGEISLIRSDGSRNTVMVYVSAILGFLALMFWPESKPTPNKKEESSNDSSESTEEATSSSEPSTTWKELITKNRKFQVVALILLVMLLLSLILGAWVVGFFGFATSGELRSVEIGVQTNLKSQVETVSINRLYFQVSVSFSFSGAPARPYLEVRILSAQNEVLHIMKWTLLRPVKGLLTTGIGISLSPDVVGQVARVQVLLFADSPLGLRMVDQSTIPFPT